MYTGAGRFTPANPDGTVIEGAPRCSAAPALEWSAMLGTASNALRGSKRPIAGRACSRELRPTPPRNLQTSDRPPTTHADERGALPLGEAFPRAYDDLRALAEHLLHRRAGAPLHTTSLVHEAWLKLARRGAAPVRDDEHLLAVAARAMRCVLADQARRRAALKRDRGRALDPVSELAGLDPLPGIDCLALHEALERLAALDERKARVVELRFFGGLDIEEVADVLGISTATVKRDWPLAKAWLYRELGETESGR